MKCAAKHGMRIAEELSAGRRCGFAAALCGKAPPFREEDLQYSSRLRLMFRISKDTPALYFTSVTHHRLPVFRTRALKDIVCCALNEARKSGGFLIFAYAVMPDHLDGIAGGHLKQSQIMRFINGIGSRRVIDYLKQNGYRTSLVKLRQQEKARRYHYSLWNHHPNTMFLTSEAVFMQRVNYIHNNPVRAGLVERAENYRWSSVRWWRRIPADDEPLRVDIDQIAWKIGKA